MTKKEGDQVSDTDTTTTPADPTAPDTAAEINDTVADPTAITPDADHIQALDDAAKAATKVARDAKKASDAAPKDEALKTALATAKEAEKAAKAALKAAKDASQPPKSGAVPVFSPNRQFTGVTAGVQFVDGDGVIPADTDNAHHLVGWFKDHGYTIGKQPAE